MLEVAKKRRKSTPEFRAEIASLVLDGGRSVVDVCKDHDLVEKLGVRLGSAGENRSWPGSARRLEQR